MHRSITTASRLLAAGAVAGAATLAFAGPPFAEKAPSGQTLQIPADLANQGTVYYALPGRDKQIYFESDAPLEDIKGQSNQVIGYAVAPSGSDRADLLGGEWHLPVRSVRTGIELRDQHLASRDWFDAANHPDIVFQLAEVRDASLAKESSGFREYSATLVGDMTIHGVTHEMVIPGASITFLEASDRTSGVAKGDLMLIRANYSVTLADYEVSHPVIGDKVAETIDITTTLFLSTVPPDRQ